MRFGAIFPAPDALPPLMPPSDPDWPRRDALFDQALDLDGAAREAFLDALPDGDRTAVVALLGLLRSSGSLGGRQQALAAAFEAPENVLPLFADLDEAPLEEAPLEDGSVVGAYRIEGELGRGGMGIVYRATRLGDGFSQAVALKVIRPGLGSDAMLERFRRERAILASLAHDGIARLVDGGTLPDGRPYLALERVEAAQPITEYADAQRLTVRERAALMARVLDVVAFAHQRLVVHRDLKPSNVLVAADGTPKLLDFGIARLLDVPDEALGGARAGDDAPDIASAQTSGARLLTPGYAAPEQVAGRPATALVDVYAAGVLLYELLCGVRPFARGVASPDGLAPLPSSRTADEATAAARRTTPSALARSLRGDLDAVCRRALAADPSGRYPSVEAFAEDLQRFVRGVPVRARPRSVVGQAQAFVRRHAAAVSVAALVLVGLLGALGAVVASRGQARAEAARARESALEAQSVSGMLERMLVSADPRVDPATLTARDLLDRGAETVGDELAAAPALDARMSLTLTGLYVGLEQDGRADSAVEAAGQRLARAAREGRLRGDALTLAQARLALAKGYALKNISRDSAAYGRFALAAQLSRRLAAPDLWVLHEAYSGMGKVTLNFGRTAEAETLFSRAVRLEALIPSFDPRDSDLSNLSAALSQGGHRKRAGEMLAADLAAMERRFGPDHVEAALRRSTRAGVLWDEGDFARAEREFRRALPVLERAYGPRYSEVVVARLLLGQVRESLGDLAGAEALVGQAHRDALAGMGPGAGLTAAVACSYGRIVARRGDGARGEALVRACTDALGRILPPGPALDLYTADLAFVRFAQGRTREADSLLRIGLPLTQRRFGDASEYTRALYGLRERLDRQDLSRGR